MVLSALGAAFIAVCSFVTVPMTVPFTLQTFAVFCVLSSFGAQTGLFAVIIYILLGVIGLPVFSNFQSGVGVLLGATGGYIVGFLFICIVYWIGQRIFRDNAVAEILSLGLGLVICYIFGTLWFVAVYTKNTGSISFVSAISVCVLPFVIPDALKLLLAVFVSKKIKKIINR